MKARTHAGPHTLAHTQSPRASLARSAAHARAKVRQKWASQGAHRDDHPQRAGGLLAWRAARRGEGGIVAPLASPGCADKVESCSFHLNGIVWSALPPSRLAARQGARRVGMHSEPGERRWLQPLTRRVRGNALSRYRPCSQTRRLPPGRQRPSREPNSHCSPAAAVAQRGSTTCSAVTRASRAPASI